MFVCNLSLTACRELVRSTWRDEEHIKFRLAARRRYNKHDSRT